VFPNFGFKNLANAQLQHHGGPYEPQEELGGRFSGNFRMLGMTLVDDLFEMGGSYVLDFSDRISNARGRARRRGSKLQLCADFQSA
jgi:hypothetical protein